MFSPSASCLKRQWAKLALPSIVLVHHHMDRQQFSLLKLHSALANENLSSVMIERMLPQLQPSVEGQITLRTRVNDSPIHLQVNRLVMFLQLFEITKSLSTLAHVLLIFVSVAVLHLHVEFQAFDLHHREANVALHVNLERVVDLLVLFEDRQLLEAFTARRARESLIGEVAAGEMLFQRRLVPEHLGALVAGETRRFVKFHVELQPFIAEHLLANLARRWSFAVLHRSDDAPAVRLHAVIVQLDAGGKRVGAGFALVSTRCDVVTNVRQNFTFFISCEAAQVTRVRCLPLEDFPLLLLAVNSLRWVNQRGFNFRLDFHTSGGCLKFEFRRFHLHFLDIRD